MTLLERLAGIYKAHGALMLATNDRDFDNAAVNLRDLIEVQKVLYGDPNAAPMNPHVGSAASAISAALSSGSHRAKTILVPK